ncbi:MAG: ribose-5-phosphate isomerase RpiA [Treponemataceae bacterium]|nr:ribose-5-phosphate isomerase RpiA [Treponemataceae bacterium]HOJ98994.1 ribose-5-phosphate isomerase RpiA [Termitinemataceae bacterium]HOM23257.1 ribose-5-phosphate isomerase RpiA [Termitinemataceae bacterium]HPQ00196.1 ribose-5-phosphate isomerase RpiA [Termitinemataceae bacterium]
MEQQRLKELVGQTAVDQLVRSGMKVGLGTGSTAMPAVRRIGELLQKGIVTDIKAVSTSFQTTVACEELGIPLYTLNSREIGGELDLTIDGADEVDPDNNLIKGGGGALLLEKIVAYASKNYAIVVDESKLVEHLGLAFPVPVEVIPEARETVRRALEKLGARVTLRQAVRKAGPVVTDKGNLLLDILFSQPVDARLLEAEINQIPGVVENGFFTRKRPQVFIARSSGIVEVRP